MNVFHFSRPFELETIAAFAVSANIEAFGFGFRINSDWRDQFDHKKNNRAEYCRPQANSDNPEGLDTQLSRDRGVAKPRRGRTDARKDRYQQCSQNAANPMYRENVEGVVKLDFVF